MSVHDRLARALERIATGTSVQRARVYDAERAARNGGTAEDARLEAAVVQFEAAADELWSALGIRAPGDAPGDALREAA